MTDESLPSRVTDEKQAAESAAQQPKKSRAVLFGIIFVLVLLIGGIVAAVGALLQPGAPTARIRDIFIIFMALESLIIGIALVVLVLQIASLINLLQNEIKPILDATNETVHTLRGTTLFLSENMVEPVVKLNSSLAALQRMLELLGIKRK